MLHLSPFTQRAEMQQIIIRMGNDRRNSNDLSADGIAHRHMRGNPFANAQLRLVGPDQASSRKTNIHSEAEPMSDIGENFSEESKSQETEKSAEIKLPRRVQTQNVQVLG